jgi:hypothetical protein
VLKRLSIPQNLFCECVILSPRIHHSLINDLYSLALSTFILLFTAPSRVTCFSILYVDLFLIYSYPILSLSTLDLFLIYLYLCTLKRLLCISTRPSTHNALVASLSPNPSPDLTSIVAPSSPSDNVVGAT